MTPAETRLHVAQVQDMKRQLHECWADCDRAVMLKEGAESQAAHFLAQRIAVETELEQVRETRDELQRQLDHAWERLGLEDPRTANKSGCPSCGVTAGHAASCGVSGAR